ncbi:glycoside hydrolase family 3 protein [Gottschalkia acidurici 9a]|uniref:Glycoside hydrolase family 3 protein n=1 Tax=Gottschalkia acidurici (strain ATCC 7906 / DSM 604 / BCRC 14475 / CIP 104303 / KCTC 5404 / NCIMB 10678 / 9a) TaxID=1128398 RepID=K0AXJ4_GOTA9|nr:beta-N-acetylhexosaminidase [Gottschalkia acidurici]AFS78543.1 glycoside hydrolase family 3 protein [Gottschalkia acidurici 9a]
MIRRKIFITLLFILVLASGCNYKNNGDSMEPKNKVESKKVDPIEESIKKMTLEEKIGQLIFVGIDDTVISEKSKELINKYKVGGIILFKRNIVDSEQTIKLMNSLKNENSKNPVPLFLGIDQEGGKVSRIPEEFIVTPTGREIGSTNDKDFAFKIGSILGKQVSYLGLNLDFAPVLDIYSNAKNTVIGDRAFGKDENVVSNISTEVIKGINSQNIIPVVKHFPGHGDTVVDSHVGLPKIDHDYERLNNFELVPFKRAIENNIDMLMVGHILLTKVDSENPATMSKTIISDILRGDLGFKGVVITDDMVMGAIVENYSIEDASIKSIQSGSDIVLIGHGYETVVKVVDNLRKAVHDGNISEERVNESVYRILKVKDKYNLNNNNTLSDVNRIKDINNELNNTLKEVR